MLERQAVAEERGIIDGHRFGNGLRDFLAGVGELRVELRALTKSEAAHDRRELAFRQTDFIRREHEARTPADKIREICKLRWRHAPLRLQIRPTCASFDSRISRSKGFMMYSLAPAASASVI
jgi:hypothetical protein